MGSTIDHICYYTKNDSQGVERLKPLTCDLT